MFAVFSLIQFKLKAMKRSVIWHLFLMASFEPGSTKKRTCCTEFHYEFVVVVVTVAAAIGLLKSNLWAEEFNWNLFCDRFKKTGLLFSFRSSYCIWSDNWPQMASEAHHIDPNIFFIIIHPVYVKRSPSLLAFDPRRVVRLRKDDDRPFLFSFSFSLFFFCLRSIKIYWDGHAPE